MIAVPDVASTKVDVSPTSHRNGNKESSVGKEVESSHEPSHGKGSRAYFLILSLTAMGIVYGDIGTSPLYAIREAFHGPFGVEPTPANVLGVLSLVFWSLILVVSTKYLGFVLRADNDGEGGILALMALVHPEHGSKTRRSGRMRVALISLGLFGAALLYSDGLLTPAISVLGAMEGIEVLNPAFHPYIIPLAIAILIGLFMIQKRGTAVVGTFFGPITLIWFLTIATLGVRGILLAPEVLAALNPIHGIRFLLSGGAMGFFVLGAVFLVVTGSEALYADMGHMGKGPIRFGWFVVVLPSLMLNYLGQGALVLTNPGAAANPFYNLAPSWFLIPLIIIATAATIIASQALITGAFSLTMQAVQLGYWPRLRIRHTSEREIGQIYVPEVNWALMVGVILVVLGFGSSSNIASAYGIAITSTMIITTILLFVVARERWQWSMPAALAFTGFFLAVEISFFAANAIKFLEGGWFPLAVGGAIFFLMTTWRQGRQILAKRLRETSMPIDKFLDDIERSHTTRVRGHAVYMTGDPALAPPALLKNLEHNRVLHMRVALLSIITQDVPHMPEETRLHVESHGSGFYRVIARYGFMDEPSAVEVLGLLRKHRIDFPIEDTTFFLGRERLISTTRPGMSLWREAVFAFMSRNALQATSYFRIPSDRVIEVGSQVEI